MPWKVNSLEFEVLRELVGELISCLYVLADFDI